MVEGVLGELLWYSRHKGFDHEMWSLHQNSPFQPNLYPTVGLQTLGEIVDANFGQQPFVYDIDEMRKVYCSIQFLPWPLVRKGPTRSLPQGVCRLESQGKSYQNHLRSGKSGKVREFEKNIVSGQGKSGNFFPNIWNENYKFLSLRTLRY